MAKQKRAVPSKAASPEELSPRKLRFIEEYLIDLNGKQAAIRAGYGANRAEVTASELLADRKVSEAVKKAQDARAEMTKITAKAVLEDLWMIAQADPREIVEHRRCCCRYCWGAGNRYQRTAGEMERDRAAHAQRVEEAKRNPKLSKPGSFDQKGGIGFNPKRDPNADCPECFGDGVGETFVHDTRKLSRTAARLYAGMKQTKEGLEVKMHSQDDALVNVGRHLGLFTDKLKIDANVKGSVAYKANMPAR
jgi:phage terminase small subunit